MNYRIIAVLVLCSGLSGLTNLHAQNGSPRGGGQGRGMMGDPKEYLEDRMAELEDLLGLSDAQAVAIQALHLEFFEKLDEARSSGDRSSAMRAQIRTLRDEADEEVIKLLSDDQASEYKELRKKEMEEMQARMRERRGQGGGRGSGGRPPGSA